MRRGENLRATYGRRDKDKDVEFFIVRDKDEENQETQKESARRARI